MLIFHIGIKCYISMCIFIDISDIFRYQKIKFLKLVTNLIMDLSTRDLFKFWYFR
jgi:hypothetical protein